MTTTDTTAAAQGAASTSPAPEPPTSGAAAKVWAALTANPDSTASAIAKAAKVSNTTAGKALATLEKDGLATHTPGSGAGRSRIPDTWTANLPAIGDADAATTPSLDTDAENDAEPGPETDPNSDTETDTETDTGTEAEAEAGSPKPDSAEPNSDQPETTPTSPPADEATDHSTETSTPPSDAMTTPTADAPTADEPPSDEPPSDAPGESRSTPTMDGHASSGDAGDSGAADSDEVTAAEQDGTTSAAAEEVPPPPVIHNGRLGKGELRAMVADYLFTHLDSDFTPTQLSRILRRSSGAISNALEILVDKEEAVQTRDHPRAYAHPDATVDLSQPVTRRTTARRASTRQARTTAAGAAGLIARAIAAHTHAASLDAEHPDQPGWGRYALTARTTLAGLLDVPTEEIRVAVEARTHTESWVRMTITDPTGTDPTASDGGTPSTTTAPTLEDTGTGDTAAETAAETVAGTELVFTAPWGEPTRILAVSACPSCGKPAPTRRITHLADLGAQLAHASAGHRTDDEAGSGGGDVAPELRNHPTHEPTCPYAAA